MSYCYAINIASLCGLSNHVDLRIGYVMRHDCGQEALLHGNREWISERKIVLLLLVKGKQVAQNRVARRCLVLCRIAVILLFTRNSLPLWTRRRSHQNRLLGGECSLCLGHANYVKQHWRLQGYLVALEVKPHPRLCSWVWSDKQIVFAFSNALS